MGSDKALLNIAGKAMLQHVIERLEALGLASIFLISNNPAAHRAFGLKMVSDRWPDGGSLGGIYTALKASTTSHTLVVPCDMPFLSVPILQHMLALVADDVDVVVPLIEDYPQGLHAIYSQACIAPIEARLRENKLKVIGFYEAVRVRYVPEEALQALGNLEHAFFNANTPEELEKARQIAESGSLDTTT